MIKITCDKCNKAISDITIYKIVPKTVILYNNHIEDVSNIPPILCCDCYSKVSSWVLRGEDIS